MQQTVSEIMTRDVQVVSPQDSLRRAAELMNALKVGALPVCSQGRLVGIVTDRDITVRATSIGMDPGDGVVDEVMSTEVRYCYEDQNIDDVMQQMSDTQIRRVPVVSREDESRLIGIVSLGDVLTRASDDAPRQDLERVIEKISFPSEPDRSSSGVQAAAGAPDSVRASDTGTGAGLAGSDVLDVAMNPDSGASSTADPSDVVEVSPADLANRNAPGSTSLSPDSLSVRAKGGQEGDVVVVRHDNTGHTDSTTGKTAPSGGTDAASVSGSSGGAAGSAGAQGSRTRKER